MGLQAGLCCGAETSRGHQRAEKMLHPDLQHPWSGVPRMGPPQTTSLPSWGTQRAPREIPTPPCDLPQPPGLQCQYLLGRSTLWSPHIWCCIVTQFPLRGVQWAGGLSLGVPQPPLSLRASQVSLDSRVREVINRKMQEPSSHTFDDAQLQIYTLMHRDSYPRFLNSAIYKSLLQTVSHSSSES